MGSSRRAEGSGVSPDVTVRPGAEEDLRRRNEELAALYDTTLALLQHHDPDDLLRDIVSRAARLAGVEHGYVYVVDPATDQLVVRAGVGGFDTHIGYRLRKGEGLAGRVWESGQPLVVDDYPRWSNARPGWEWLGTAAGIPLTSASGFLGVIGLAHAEVEPFPPHTMELLDRFGRIASLTLENAHLFRAARDELVERQRAEEALRRSEERYRTYVETAPDVVFTLDPDGTFSSLNPAFEAITGYPVSEWLGKSFAQILHPDDLAAAVGLFQKVLAGQPVPLFELRYLHASGEYRVGEFTAAPMYRGSEVIGGLGIGRDVTDRKRVDEALAESEERFRKGFEEAPIGIALVAPDGRWLRVNQELCRITGRSEEELLATDFQSITHPDDLDADLEYVRQMLAGEIRTYQMEKRYFHRSGRIVWILLSVSLVRDADGQPRYFISQIEDITERKMVQEEFERANEQLERANAELRSLDELKSRFVAMASHELRTPLTSVAGFAATMVRHWDTLADEEKREYVGLIDEQAQRLHRLVADLLTMSRIESGAVEVRTVSVPAREAIGLAIRSFGERTDGIRVDCPDDVRVAADPDHLQQILLNYLGNAIRHGRPPIDVEVRAAGDAVELRVRDRGPGVPEDLRPLLFERFVSGQRGGEGSGLGLSIVLGLAQANGGDAWYEPNRRGAVFCLRLPRAQPTTAKG